MNMSLCLPYSDYFKSILTAGFVLFTPASALAISEFCSDPENADICENVPEWWQDHVASQQPYGGFRNTVPGDSIAYLGLEWLTWDQTVNMSINQALDVYGAEGWRLASLVEVTTLFNSLFASTDDGYIEVYDRNINDWYYTGTTNFSSNENIEQVSWSPASHDNFWFMSDNFGITDYLCDETFFDGCYEYTSALFGDDADGDGLYNRAYFQYEHYWDNSSTYAVLEDDEYDANFIAQDQKSSAFYSHSTGIALVRSPRPSPKILTPVPEINIQGFALALTLLSSLILLAKERLTGRQNI